MNRLRDAVYIKPESNTKVTNAYDERLAYDANGNILELQRNGYRDADDNLPLEIDRLLYAYNPNSNQLRSVADYTQCLDGFRDGITANLEYDYDSYGNMTTDGNKGVSIIYNHLNLPVLVEFGNGGQILYLYDASGVKLRKTVIDNNSNVTTTDYLNGFQYTDGKLSFFPTAEGYVKCTRDQFNYVYNYTDHLGNNRLSYTWDRDAQTVKIMEENNYYPFGLKQENYNVEKVDYKKVDVPGAFAVQLANVGRMAYQYKFQGQERQDELGLNWDSFKWRNYDPAIARFMSIDPLTEEYEDYTPYQFASNQPVHAQEVEGLENSHDLNKRVQQERTVVRDNIPNSNRDIQLKRALTSAPTRTPTSAPAKQGAMLSADTRTREQRDANNAKWTKHYEDQAKLNDAMNNHDNLGHPATQLRVMEGVADGMAGMTAELAIGKAAQGIKALTEMKALTALDDVASFVSKNGTLPSNFITKAEAQAAGWSPKLGNLSEVAPGKSIGGDIFKNSEGLLPNAEGRIWREADINFSGGYRGNERLLYSNDGLMYKTTDHYKTFTQITN